MIHNRDRPEIYSLFKIEIFSIINNNNNSLLVHGQIKETTLVYIVVKHQHTGV